MITRRELLLVRRLGPRVLGLSGECMYMRYVDSCIGGTTAHLFDTLASELRDVDELVVSHSAWLARPELSTQLDPVLAAFRARGGRVSVDS